MRCLSQIWDASCGLTPSFQLPTFSPYDPRMTCEFPICHSSPDVWSDQINIMRQTTRAFELLMSVDYPDPVPSSDTATSSTTSATSPPLAGGISRSHKHQEMLAIDRRVLAMLKDAEKVAIKEVRKNMGAEEEMARNFQLSALFMVSWWRLCVLTRMDLTSAIMHSSPSPSSLSTGRRPSLRVSVACVCAHTKD